MAERLDCNTPLVPSLRHSLFGLQSHFRFHFQSSLDFRTEAFASLAFVSRPPSAVCHSRSLTHSVSIAVSPPVQSPTDVIVIFLVVNLFNGANPVKKHWADKIQQNVKSTYNHKKIVLKNEKLKITQTKRWEIAWFRGGIGRIMCDEVVVALKQLRLLLFLCYCSNAHECMYITAFDPLHLSSLLSFLPSLLPFTCLLAPEMQNKAETGNKQKTIGATRDITNN